MKISNYKGRVYEIEPGLAPNNNFFISNDSSVKFLKKWGKEWVKVYNEFWPIISNTKKMEDNKERLGKIREGLKPGDLTLVGVIADGGQGMATGCNAIHLAVREGSAEGERVCAKVERVRQDIENRNAAGLKARNGCRQVQQVVQNLRERGHSYAEAEFNFVHKIITDDQILDVSQLTPQEREHIKRNGISEELAQKYRKKTPTYVPYYKGQKGKLNKWVSRVDFYVDWSEENVSFFKEHAGRKFSGGPRWQSPQFYFEPGVGWNLIGKETTGARRMTANPGVNGCGCPKIDPVYSVSKAYMSAFLNSSYAQGILLFVSNTVNRTTNDVKQLPIIIPSPETHDEVVSLVRQCEQVVADDTKSVEERQKLLKPIEKEIDNLIESTFF